MKKRVLALFLATMLLLSVTACTAPEQGGGTTTTTAAPTTTTTQTTTTTIQPEQPGVGGDMSFYSRTYVLEFSMESRLWSLVDKDEFDAWMNSFEDFGGKRSGVELNVYSFIKEFGIPREMVEDICRKYKENFGGDYFTDKQVEMLYNGKEEEVYAFFANPAGIMIGKTVYPPRWLAEHSVEEYKEAGITAAMIDEKWDEIAIACAEQHKLKELEIILEKKNQL